MQKLVGSFKIWAGQHLAAPRSAACWRRPRSAGSPCAVVALFGEHIILYGPFGPAGLLSLRLDTDTSCPNSLVRA